ncbi:hypothetical protein [Granulicella tundricola]|uniref:DUF4760 domain-containing protein n=1 Tax=Granulicella tundricola (strain ATCC BAA-1859 / DSM 23138 / MP5ACTX9) TaxID=1198114 RepID=E8X290_GRATM|nr:hypothetical protein [Granulicella tundricola]ADW68022.1 hypothetical protein AciX9_0955 [Granulicella tundricola MP5ACTX9]
MAVDWVAVQAVATSILVLTSVGAIGYAGLQLRHERNYRSVENLEKQLSFFLSENFVGARRRLAQARLDVSNEDQPALLAWSLEAPPVSVFEVLDFYEHLSLLVKKGHLDVYDVWHTFYEWAQPVYVDMQPLIESAESMYAEHYDDLEHLMRQMDEIQINRMHNQKGNHWALWTPDRIIEHYRYELESGGRPRRTRRVPAREARDIAREVVREIQQSDPDAGPVKE